MQVVNRGRWVFEIKTVQAGIQEKGSMQRKLSVDILSL